MKKFYHYAVLLLSLVVAASCEKDSKEETKQDDAISVKNGKCAVTSDSSVDISCSVTGATSDMTFGLYYSRASAEPSESDLTVTTGKIGADGSFTITMTDLLKYHKYYYRPFVKAGKDYYYGEVDSFQIAKYQVQAGEPVDLGLSVKWANFNIGATAPDGYGDLFAWGETAPKDNFTLASYFDYDYKVYHLVYEKGAERQRRTFLQPKDDAATVNWGGTWRMPTRDEMVELLDNCTWTWTALNDVNGYKVQSKTNDNWIFLPAGGDESLINVGKEGYYWTSFLADWNDGSNEGATGVEFNSKAISYNYYYRESAMSIRPVTK